MPSPLGHALAGATLALLADRPARRPDAVRELELTTRVTVCVLCAALPDADLIYPPIHRAFTHSVGSTLLVTIIATLVTGWVTGRRSLGFGLLCGAAWGSHTVLDWMGADPNPPFGIKAFWPFSDRWVISGWDLFRGTERRRVFTLDAILYNARAMAQEAAILGPVLLAAIWWRRRGRARDAAVPAPDQA